MIYFYLKNFFIQNPCSKNCDSIGVYDCRLTSIKWFGGFLFTINNHCHSFLLHADCYPMPPNKASKSFVNFKDIVAKSLFTLNTMYFKIAKVSWNCTKCSLTYNQSVNRWLLTIYPEQCYIWKRTQTVLRFTAGLYVYADKCPSLVSFCAVAKA